MLESQPLPLDVKRLMPSFYRLTNSVMLLGVVTAAWCGFYFHLFTAAFPTVSAFGILLKMSHKWLTSALSRPAQVLVTQDEFLISQGETIEYGEDAALALRGYNEGKDSSEQIFLKFKK